MGHHYHQIVNDVPFSQGLFFKDVHEKSDERAIEYVIWFYYGGTL